MGARWWRRPFPDKEKVPLVRREDVSRTFESAMFCQKWRMENLSEGPITGRERAFSVKKRDFGFGVVST